MGGRTGCRRKKAEIAYSWKRRGNRNKGRTGNTLLWDVVLRWPWWEVVGVRVAGWNDGKICEEWSEMSRLQLGGMGPLKVK